MGRMSDLDIDLRESMTRCAYCSEPLEIRPRSRGLCEECHGAHSAWACEARPGACDACALLSDESPRGLAFDALHDPSLRGNARTYAEPYLLGLTRCPSMHDRFIADDVPSMLAYALANVSTWRGQSAREWKERARDMLARARAL